jgi:tRNA dimethylallyltransferase
VGGRNPNQGEDALGLQEGLVLAIFGPTASGKTQVAEAVARRIPSELVSADSMQAYRGVPILTNQSTTATRLVGIWALEHAGSVAEFAGLAHEAIDEILRAAKLPIVVGGTGLYLRAALADLGVPPSPAAGSRKRLEGLYDQIGADRAHALLAERDPAAAANVHPNDRRRVVRALELAEAGSSLRPADNRLWAGKTRHPTLVVGLDVPCDVVLARIENRTVEMFRRGVEAEVARARTGAISVTAEAIIGLSEVSSLPREEAIEAIIKRTARLAAYQRKWMRRMAGVVSVAADRPPGEVADEILEMARARQRLPAHRAV